MRRVTILGSTGSIGRSTVAVLTEAPDFEFAVEALVGGDNVGLLIEQARALRPSVAVIASEKHLDALRTGLAGTGIQAQAGHSAVIDAAARPSDWVMSAITGAAGLKPTLAAVARGAKVALANKECLVCAGSLFMDAARTHGATLLPVDSEHNAIFQVLGRPQDVEKLILTASGGPFRTHSLESMRKASAAEALDHPNWAMGQKISIDSATMMNKGLELIEAAYLFGVPEERIEIVVHPQSIVHSLVSYRDGSVLAQLGAPDMRIPIAHALAWPDRIQTTAPRLDLAAIGNLSFEAPDLTRFPALEVARGAMKMGQGAPTALNAANEVAVRAFLDGQIAFLDIAALVTETLEALVAHGLIAAGAEPRTFEDVHTLDETARRVAVEHRQRFSS
ncbi:MAG: 1-deoxy-D-xylulose-5-phosphate reductoisomerase [Caulobacterales bacterium]